MTPDDPNLDDFVRWELELHRQRLADRKARRKDVEDQDADGERAD